MTMTRTGHGEHVTLSGDLEQVLWLNQGHTHSRKANCKCLHYHFIMLCYVPRKRKTKKKKKAPAELRVRSLFYYVGQSASIEMYHKVYGLESATK